MARLGNISGKDAVAAFQRLGWTLRNVEGSHFVMTKPGNWANLSIPMHSKDLGIGLIKKLLKISGVSMKAFLDHGK